jgi:hypothetical protein
MHHSEIGEEQIHARPTDRPRVALGALELIETPLREHQSGESGPENAENHHGDDHLGECETFPAACDSPN